MSYTSIVEMASSQSLISRIAAAAAQEGYEGTAVQWAQSHVWSIASATDWVAAWDYAKNSLTDNANPDLGIHDDIINDAMILSAVQPLLAVPDETDA